MATEQDVLNKEYRKEIITEILGSENRQRKAEALRRIEVYNSRLAPFVIKALENEYSEKSAQEMRKICSINLAKRIIDETASIYKSPPKRTFNGATKKQEDLLLEHYRRGKANVKLKKANARYKLMDQCALQVIPLNGVIEHRVYCPHQYDVIPREDDPERAMAYIINTMDRMEFLPPQQGQDFRDQNIADPDDHNKDYLRLSKMRFIWWTDNYNFITNGHGDIVSSTEDIENPIHELPFVDIAGEKDFEFWVRTGCSVVDFAIDFLVILSDNATSNRNQGFSQGVLTATEKPESVVLGRQRVLFLKQDPDPEKKDPKFEFVTPAPDLSGSLEMTESFVRYWLSSQGIDPKTISGKLDSQRYSSGIERLLAMIDKFEASKDDIDAFRDVEDKVLRLIIKWNNVYQNTDALIPELQKGLLSEDITLDVKFAEPNVIQTQSEREDSFIKLQKAGLKDEVDYLIEVEEIDEKTAIERVVERKVRQAKLQKMIEERLRAEGLEPQPETEAVNGDQEEGDGEDEEDDSSEVA